MQLVLGEELVAAEASDEFSLDGRKVIEGWREEDVFVGGGRRDLI